MTHDEKIQALLQHARRHQVAPGSAAPPFWRLLWKLGLRLPPPHFLGFWQLVLVCGSFFGSIWGLVVYLLVWRAQQLPLAQAAGTSLCAGALFGCVMAAVYRRQARRLRLPAWHDYGGG